VSENSSFRPKCPTCDILVDPAASLKHLPFCSERCRLRDLGRWLNEEHALPCESTSDAEQQSADGPASAPRLPPGWHDA